MPMYQNFDDSYRYIEGFYDSLELRDAVGKAITGKPPLGMSLVVNDVEYVINSKPDIVSSLREAQVPEKLIEEIILSKFQLFENILFKDPDFDKNGKYWKILIKLITE